MQREYVYWIACAATLLLMVPGASADLDRWDLDSQQNGIQAIIVHQYPEHTIPLGGEFFVSMVASGSQDNSDDFGYGAINTSGCTVVDSAITSGLTATKGLWIHMRQDDVLCAWWVQVTITDTGIGGGGTTASFRVTGSAVATDNVELTDGGSLGGVGYWLPTLVFIGAALYFLSQSRVGPAVVATILALGTQFEAWPIPDAFGLLLLPLVAWLEMLAQGDWLRGRSDAK